ncbi:alpha/beta hydrolase [Lentisphaera profundi]|uniref:Alpha/beta hydrolase n=1 Tax=Lentisphaera profundi TaxID=1658616 RepID=A0ABY7VNL9_9BACT|nr:alpha/beta hydrolase [Lentisphaera profundi]WDE95257.1 alpha/beta hydrolase [Lentisphaera profundi]
MKIISLLIMFGTVLQANDLRYFAEHDKREIKSEIIDSQHQLRLISSLPDNWQESDKRSAFVFIHGGGWLAGEPENFIPHMRYFSSRGAVCFSINYRLLKTKNYRWNKKLSDEENKINEQKKLQEFIAGPSLTELISDCEKAMLHIRKNASSYGIDPKGLIVIGDSAGGHLASCMATIVKPEARANALVDCNGITDLTYEPWISNVKPCNDPISKAKQASPVFNIPTQPIPALILHGDQDFIVVEKMAREFHNALYSKGYSSEFKLYKGARHAFIVYNYSATLEETTQCLLDIDAFAVKHNFLKGPATIKMPNYSNSDKRIILESKQVKAGQEFTQVADFPGQFTLSLKIKPEKKFNGSLLQLAGSFGLNHNVHNNGHDLSSCRFRQRNNDFKLIAEQWNDYQLAVFKDKVVITLNGQTLEYEKNLPLGFISNTVIIGKGLKAEIKDLKFYNSPF